MVVSDRAGDESLSKKNERVVKPASARQSHKLSRLDGG